MNSKHIIEQLDKLINDQELPAAKREIIAQAREKLKDPGLTVHDWIEIIGILVGLLELGAKIAEHIKT